jgi:hypothetical protein
VNWFSFFLGMVALPALLALACVALCVRFVIREAWLLYQVRRYRAKRKAEEERERAEDEAWCRKLIEAINRRPGETLAEEIQAWYREREA